MPRGRARSIRGDASTEPREWREKGRGREKERDELKHLVRTARAAMVAPGNPALIYTRPVRRSINPGPIVKRGECDRPADRNYNYPGYLRPHNSQRRAIKMRRARSFRERRRS